jgi:hypothetical protein
MNPDVTIGISGHSHNVIGVVKGPKEQHLKNHWFGGQK